MLTEEVKMRAKLNGDMPAVGLPTLELSQRAEEGHYDHFCFGLTKREQFAMAAMQGLIGTQQGHSLTVQELSAVSVKTADMMLIALEQER